MKKILLILFLISISTVSLSAQEKGVGAGVILGAPTGISGKYWIDTTNAIDAGLGWDFLENASRFSFHVDYLYHNYSLVDAEIKMPVYYGFGLRFRFKSGVNGSMGIRGVVGASLYLRNQPIELFGEIAPSFRLLPSTGLDFDAGIGARYYFNIKNLGN